jgi:hypothetical protein
MSRLRRLVAVLSPRSPGLDAVSSNVISVVDNVPLETCFLLALPFSPVFIIPLMIHTHFSFISISSEEKGGKGQKPSKTTILSDNGGQTSEDYPTFICALKTLLSFSEEPSIKFSLFFPQKINLIQATYLSICII